MTDIYLKTDTQKQMKSALAAHDVSLVEGENTIDTTDYSVLIIGELPGKTGYHVNVRWLNGNPPVFGCEIEVQSPTVVWFDAPTD